MDAGAQAMSRTRYVYTQGGQPLPEPIKVSDDWTQPDAERQPVFTDRYMEGVRAADGSDISSRTKRREYMKREGVADASDFTQTFQKAKEARARMATGDFDHARRREAIRRAIQKVRKP